MPLQLPPPLQTPLHTGQGPLQEPSNPPTANDVVMAAANARLVFGTYNIGGAITAEEASAALEYGASVINAKLAAADPIDAAPPWFQAAVNGINERLDQQRERLDQQWDAISRIERITAISHNRTALTGSVRPLQEVPFPDGTRPTIDHNYPIIDSIQALENLTNPQLKKYHRKYCPLRVGVNGALPRPIRIREVLTATGCDDNVISD